jgi:hypothetical protein
VFPVERAPCPIIKTPILSQPSTPFPRNLVVRRETRFDGGANNVSRVGEHDGVRLQREVAHLRTSRVPRPPPDLCGAETQPEGCILRREGILS